MKCALSTHTDVLIHEMQLRYIYDILFSPSPCLHHPLPPHPSDEKVDLNDSKWEDIHVTTGALKMFFRELPEPLFTYGSFNDFVNAISE